MNASKNSLPTSTGPDDWVSRSHVQILTLTGLTLFGLYLCYRMAEPLLAPLVWALALAVLFLPLQRWLEAKLRRASFAALVTSLAVSLLIAVPTVFLAQRLVMEAAKGAALVELRVRSGEWRRSIQAQPRLAPLLDGIERRIDLPGTMATVSSRLSNAGEQFVRGSLLQVIHFGLTFYLLFYFLRDRQVTLQALRMVSPLPTCETNQLTRRIGDTIHATIYGTLAVSAIQGLLGGLMFWWLGLSAPLLWGTVMALSAVVPVLGAFLIWIPAALFLALEGSWIRALILTGWGTAIVGTADNLLRPILVGNRLQLHTILTFISLVGGLVVFGPSGLILGPVVLTATIVLMEIWARRIRLEEGRRGSVGLLAVGMEETKALFRKPGIDRSKPR